MFKAIKKTKAQGFATLQSDPILEIDATFIAGWIYVDW